jgi:hypothetical protein
MLSLYIKVNLLFLICPEIRLTHIKLISIYKEVTESGKDFGLLLYGSIYDSKKFNSKGIIAEI